MSILDDVTNEGQRMIYEELSSTFPIFDNIGKVGSFGDISFKVNEKYILTPGKINITKGNSLHKHEGINAPDVSEFKKRNLRKVSFPVKLSYDYISISTVRKKLERMVENGEHHPLMIGGEGLSDNDFILLSVTENISYTDGNGSTLLTEFNLEFEEYVSQIQRGNDVSVKMLKQKGTSLANQKIIKETNRKVLASIGKKLW